MNMEQLVNLAFLTVLEQELYKEIERTERELTQNQNQKQEETNK